MHKMLKRFERLSKLSKLSWTSSVPAVRWRVDRAFNEVTEKHKACVS